jgi:demethylmenaquinone methyltransferase/2-methoxy-6-polyprenyl-1,4-benzoquinol methylase
VQTPTVDPKLFAQDLFRPIPRRYDVLEELLSFGQNWRWRREMIAHAAAHEPKTVLDVATGTAGVALALTSRTTAHITGVDITEAMLRRGHERVSGRGAADRVRLVLGQAERLPFPDASFDALTFTYLLRYVADPAATSRELVRVLTPGASIASLEFSVPPNPFWRFWWWLYTRAV